MFSWNDQVRLHGALVRAARRGAQIVVTNADHLSVRELYDPRFTYHQLLRSSVLAGDPIFRGATTEAMFIANF